MNPDLDPEPAAPPAAPPPPSRNEDAACDTCGRFGAFAIGDRSLCDACYESAGACGPGGGDDD